MAPPKTAKGNVDAKKGNTITEYFKAGKPRSSKAKNPLTEEQKLKRFKEGSLLLDPYYHFTFDFQNYIVSVFMMLKSSTCVSCCRVGEVTWKM